jgi:hypothetical protein
MQLHATWRDASFERWLVPMLGMQRPDTCMKVASKHVSLQYQRFNELPAVHLRPAAVDGIHVGALQQKRMMR